MKNLSAWAPVPLRLALGLVFLAHGLQKTFGLFGGAGFEATVDTFRKFLGLPAPVTGFVALAETLGGAALLLGFKTRWAAAALIAVMAGAVLKVHAAHGFFLNWANLPGRGHGLEYNLVLAAGLLAVALSGPGPASLDR